jgi:hypothetical protein
LKNGDTDSLIIIAIFKRIKRGKFQALLFHEIKKKIELKWG